MFPQTLSILSPAILLQSLLLPVAFQMVSPRPLQNSVVLRAYQFDQELFQATRNSSSLPMQAIIGFVLYRQHAHRYVKMEVNVFFQIHANVPRVGQGQILPFPPAMHPVVTTSCALLHLMCVGANLVSKVQIVLHPSVPRIV